MVSLSQTHLHNDILLCYLGLLSPHPPCTWHRHQEYCKSLQQLCWRKKTNDLKYSKMCWDWRGHCIRIWSLSGVEAIQKIIIINVRMETNTLSTLDPIQYRVQEWEDDSLSISKRYKDLYVYMYLWLSTSFPSVIAHTL